MLQRPIVRAGIATAAAGIAIGAAGVAFGPPGIARAATWVVSSRPATQIITTVAALGLNAAAQLYRQ